MLSVADVVRLPGLALKKVVSLPHPEEPVRWVATSELPDPAPYLEGGELLLTTGLVAREESEWREFTRRLSTAGAVGVGFAIGVNHPTVPEALIRGADAAGLNLFIVPKPTPFTAVSKAVAEALAADEREEDRRALDHQRALTSAAITGSEQLVAELGRVLGGRAAVLDTEGARMLGDPGLAARAREQLPRLRSSPRRAAVTAIDAGGRVHVQPIERRGRVEAFLAIGSAAAFEPAERNAISTALALLALDRDRAAVTRAAERRIRTGAVSLLLTGDASAAEALLDGLPFTHASVTRAVGEPDAVARALVQSLEREPGVVASAADGSLVAIGDHDIALDDLTVGIGTRVPLARLRESDAEARTALESASSSRRVVRFAELVDEGVDAAMPAEWLARFATALLGPVLEQADAAELTSAARAYLAHGGQVGPAASELGVHRNTLTRRLALLESLVGRSLDDAQARADMWIALEHAP